MPRNISNDLKTASESDVIIPVILVKLEYASGNVNAHSAVGTIVFNGDTYLGVGQYGSVTATAETSDGSANYVDLELSGVESALVSIQLNEHYQGRRGTLYYGLFDKNSNALIEPTIIFRGLMDNSEITLGETGSIKLRINNRLAEWDKINLRRYTDTEQQFRFPGDTGLQFVQRIAETQLIWGK